MELTRHGIGAAGMKRMAPANPFQTQPKTARGAMNLNRFTHIV
ncbi:MAG TPA: hypothetical protein VG273_02025 [Bryobacteraceae bacterium]|jgi:hypothetical protein|nr:hypothetical protein [Bryobacteraceae bacterium]